MTRLGRLLRAALPAGLAAGLLSVAPPASAIEQAMAPNGFTVAGTAGRFEVFPFGSVDGPRVFCAAGDFARRLGARETDRVEMLTGVAASPTRPARRSVSFAVRPRGSGRNRGLDVILLSPPRAGLSRSVAFAAAQCDVPRFGHGRP